MSLSKSLDQILQDYSKAKLQAFNANNHIAVAFKDLEAEIRGLDYIKNNPNLKVTASYGKGNWANVPWIAIMDARETTTTQNGVYCVFLFKQDMTGVYITYNQGVTNLS